MEKPNRHTRRQHGWKSWFRSFFVGPRVASGLPRRMHLESLEPRWVRSSFAVTDNSDNAADVNSLRYAIDHLAAGTAANTNTITIASVLTGGQTITLGSQLAISEGVTITGPGASTVALSGGNSFNVLVDTGVNASIADLTITKGGGGAGGVIENLGTLSLDNCTLSGNTATANGGALYNVNGSLSINNCTLSGNTANSGGGAVSNSRGSVSIANSTISGNTVTTGGGGGIYDYRGSVSINNTTISGNAANSFIIVDHSPAPNVEQEGGGGVDEQYGSMSIANSTISGNSAGPSGGPGGGVVNEAGTISIMNSTVSGNTANADGGGIANNSTMSITNCTITGNSATVSGGALSNSGGSLSIANSTISGNTATSSAGGIYNKATATLQNSIVSVNNAPTAPDAAGGFTDLGNNLLGTALHTGSPPASDVFTNTPGLAALANYGGPTQTMALLASSPAIAAGSVLGGGMPATDQRGDSRPTTGPIDIGADQYTVGSITGTVFRDLNGNGIQDTGESGIAGATVYIDLNHSGQFVSGDPSAVTDGNGNFTIGLLAIGSYTIREDAVPGSVNLTTPEGGSVAVNLTMAAPSASVDFGQIQSSGMLPVAPHPNLFKNDTSDASISYIKSLYQAILDRLPGVLEYENWVGYLDSLGGVANSTARQDLANEIWNAQEHRVDEVLTYYQTLLGRSGVGDSGAVFWVHELEVGVGELAVARAIMSSAEYQNKTANDNSAFVQNLLGAFGVTGTTQVTLGGSPLDLRAALNAGLLTRTQVVGYAVGSDQALLATVGATYQGYLQRLAGADAGVAYWAEEIRINGVQYVGVAVFGSQEYFHDIQANL